MNKFKAMVVAATAFAAVGFAGTASAQVSGSFVLNPSNNSGPGAGFNVVQNFNSCTTASCAGLTGSNYQIYTGNVPNYGAVPNNSGSPYLAVLGGGTATYTFAGQGTSQARFDWGTVSSDNTLTVLYRTGSSNQTQSFVVTGSDIGQSLYNQNGIFTATAAAGSVITGLTFQTGLNSFEVDNVSAAVPEPATWGMMILGFGAIGAVVRRRKAVVRFA